MIERGRAGRGRVHRELFRGINQPAERMLQAPLTPLAPVWTWEAQRLSLPPPPIHSSSLGMIERKVTSFPSSSITASSVASFGVGSHLALFQCNNTSTQTSCVQMQGHVVHYLTITNTCPNYTHIMNYRHFKFP